MNRNKKLNTKTIKNSIFNIKVKSAPCEHTLRNIVFSLPFVHLFPHWINRNENTNKTKQKKKKRKMYKANKNRYRHKGSSSCLCEQF